jgi:hypothetical protein
LRRRWPAHTKRMGDYCRGSTAHSHHSTLQCTALRLTFLSLDITTARYILCNVLMAVEYTITLDTLSHCAHCTGSQNIPSRVSRQVAAWQPVILRRHSRGQTRRDNERVHRSRSRSLSWVQSGYITQQPPPVDIPSGTLTGASVSASAGAWSTYLTLSELIPAARTRPTL